MLSCGPNWYQTAASPWYLLCLLEIVTSSFFQGSWIPPQSPSRDHGGNFVELQTVFTINSAYVALFVCAQWLYVQQSSFVWLKRYSILLHYIHHYIYIIYNILLRPDDIKLHIQYIITLLKTTGFTLTLWVQCPPLSNFSLATLISNVRIRLIPCMHIFRNSWADQFFQHVPTQRSKLECQNHEACLAPTVCCADENW